MPQSEAPADNLVRAFSLHLEACNAAGLSPKTIEIYDGRYKQFLTFLKAQGHQPPFQLELLTPVNARRASIWIREHSHGRRGGEHAAKALIATLKTGSAWLADEGYLDDEVDPLARLRRPKASSSARLPLTQEDVRALRSAALDSQTGMRIGGLCSIMLADLDMRERRLVLRLKGGRQHVLYFGSPERRDGGGTVRAVQR